MKDLLGTSQNKLPWSNAAIGQKMGFCKRLILFSALFVCLIGSVALGQDKPKELLVFAGAGMRLPLDEIGKRFEERYGVRVIYDYEGSGRLGNKILVGQTPDVFIPGSEKWAKILKEKRYIKDYTPVAYHTPVIITPERNNKVKSLGDFVDNNNRIVLGNAKATAIGEASAVILKKAGLNESNMNIRARGISVKQLVMWIEKNNADASIVWKADAIQSGKVKPIDIPEQYISTYIIPVCQMIRHKEEASQYIRYLLGAEAKGIFGDYGFDVVK